MTATMSVLRAAPAIALLLFGVSASSAGSPRQYEDYHKSAYLPYINAPGPLEDITEVPRLRISFGTRSYSVVMDTGSTGVVVSADKIPNIRGLQSLGPGKLTYSSSGRIMMGQWVVTPMTIIGGDGTRVTTAPMPVLAVTQVQCMEGARRCTPNEAPHQISMMGIGFGRRHDRQAQSGPDTNPFLNTAKLGEGGPNVERMRRGYIVTRRGIHIGLTSANTQGDFAYIKLVPEADGKDWAATPACISVNGAKPAACGSLLMDTGVTTMYLTVPNSQASDTLVMETGRATTLVKGTNSHDLEFLTNILPRRSTPSRSATTPIRLRRPISLWLAALVRPSSIPACISSTASIISMTPMAAWWASAGRAMRRKPSAKSSPPRHRIDADQRIERTQWPARSATRSTW